MKNFLIRLYQIADFLGIMFAENFTQNKKRNENHLFCRIHKKVLKFGERHAIIQPILHRVNYLTVKYWLRFTRAAFFEEREERYGQHWQK